MGNNIITTNTNRIFYSEHWHIEGANAWLFSYKFNAVCRVDFNNKTIKYLGTIPFHGDNEESEFSYVVKVGKKLVFLPDRCNEIYLLDLDNNNWCSIPIDNNGKNRLRCTDGILKNDRLFVYSAYLKNLISIDVEKGIIDGYYSLSDKEGELLWDEEIARYNNKLFYGSRNTPEIYIYDLNYNNYVLKRINETDSPLRAVICCDDMLWISNSKGALYIYDINTFTLIKEISVADLMHEKSRGSYPYLSMAVTDDYVWLIPYDFDNIVFVDKKTFSVESIKCDFGNNNSEQTGRKQIVNYIRDKRFIGISSLNNRKMYEIDADSKRIKQISFYFENHEAFLQSIRKKSGRMHSEDDFFGLNDFLLSL